MGENDDCPWLVLVHQALAHGSLPWLPTSLSSVADA